MEVMVKKRGRKKIGTRESFHCPDDLHHYVEQHRKEIGVDAWSEALRAVIRDHRSNFRRTKNSTNCGADLLQ